MTYKGSKSCSPPQELSKWRKMMKNEVSLGIETYFVGIADVHLVNIDVHQVNT